MKTIGRYLVIIISVTEMMLSVNGVLNEEDTFYFLKYIFDLHNDYRHKHRAEPLERNRHMDLVAAHILDDIFIEKYNEYHDVYGKNIGVKMYDRDTILDNDEAESIFLDWYRKGSNYDYSSEPSDYESHKEFTQIVWQNTETIGIAMKCRNNKYFVQIVYLPCGNIPGKFENNVLQRPIIAYKDRSSLNQRIYDNDVEIFKKYIAQWHNEYRQKHRAGPLYRTPEMDLVAAQILDDMFIGQYNEIYDEYGKNLAERIYDRNTILNADEAEILFFNLYEKGFNYDYFSEPSDYESHKEFTQIVWQNTETIGIAMKCSNNKYFVQIVYFPRGNIPEQFENNVLQRPIISDSNKSFLNRHIYDNDIDNIEKYIVYLHNEARIEHGLPELERDTQLDKFAFNILNYISRNKYKYHGMYGRNYLTRTYDHNTILDKEEAKAIFSKWYEMEINYETAESNQILWSETKTMGISILKEDGFYRILAFYDPRRNAEDKEDKFSLYFNELSLE